MFFLRCAVAAVALLAIIGDVAGADSHVYAAGDEVEMLVNTVGPYSNPSETYQYYELPFCKPMHVEQRANSLGEVLEGSMKQTSMYEIRFGVDVPPKVLCTVTLGREDIEQLRTAIKQFYYFEMFYDDLPIWGFVGSVVKDDDRSDGGDNDGGDGDELAVVSDEGDDDDGDASTRQFYLFKHLDFKVLRNGDRIVKVNCTADPSKVVLLTADMDQVTIEFSYTATWAETTWPFEKRMELYEDSFFAQELDIHWLSIMNSCVLVVLLTGFLALIVMRVLKSDYARYSRADEEEEEQEDYGWKLVHGDVFRFPANKLLFTAFLGLGAQLLAVTALVLLLALGGIFHPSNGGAMYSSLIAIYALTSAVGGFVSGRFYAQMGGTNWSWNLVAQATLFAVPVIVVVLTVNAVALYWKATASLPFTTMVIVLMIWLLVGVPLCVLGGIAGKNTAGQFNAPVRTKNFPREIPHIPLYRRWYTQMVMSGFLPFSAIYIELFYVFSSIWGHSSYQLFGILVVVFAILFAVVSCITVALTYFQLSMEDHRWWWSSFFCGGSVAFFIYAYAIFFFHFRSKMSGALQGSFYFGYMLVICYFFFIVCGSIGAFSSLAFTRYIYASLKID